MTEPGLDLRGQAPEPVLLITTPQCFSLVGEKTRQESLTWYSQIGQEETGSKSTKTSLRFPGVRVNQARSIWALRFRYVIGKIIL